MALVLLWLALDRLSVKSPPITAGGSAKPKGDATATATIDPPSTHQLRSIPRQTVEASGDDAPFADFDKWTARFLAAATPERVSMIAEGSQLAETRRAALAALIPADPKRALHHAVPMVVRQVLPTEIVARLEERVSARGFYGVLGVVGQPAADPAILREVRLGEEKRYKAHT